MDYDDDWRVDTFTVPSFDHRHIIVQIAESIVENANYIATLATETAAELAAEPEGFDEPLSADAARLLWVRWAQLRDASTIGARRRALTADLLLAVVTKLAELQQMARACDAEMLRDHLEDLLDDPDLIQAFHHFARSDSTCHDVPQIASPEDIAWARHKCAEWTPST